MGGSEPRLVAEGIIGEVSEPEVRIVRPVEFDGDLTNPDHPTPSLACFRVNWRFVEPELLPSLSLTRRRGAGWGSGGRLSRRV